MKHYDVIVVGAGPAGLGAAIEAGRLGAHVLLLDENDRPGGQLFKQIHKFFGSREHYAGTRGFAIGQMLLEEAREAGVEIALGRKVWGSSRTEASPPPVSMRASAITVPS